MAVYVTWEREGRRHYAIGYYVSQGKEGLIIARAKTHVAGALQPYDYFRIARRHVVDITPA